MSAGLVILGVGVICWGVSGVIEGRMIFTAPGVRHRESYYGLAARLWGVLISMAGVALVGFGSLLIYRPGSSFEQVIGSPIGVSVGMLLGGVAGIIYAGTLILGRGEAGGSWLRVAASLPGRLIGLLVMLISMGLAAAGAASIVAPQTYERVVQSISDRLPRAPQPDRGQALP
ncbi:MAG: hypothetical protein M3430_07955 [Acidobacteriota bacterium]|nr:hypothetical protein [Acidobacteriota bacterium]